MLKPLYDKVIVKEIVKEETSKSGIYIPKEASGSRHKEGIVMAVGPGRMSEMAPSVGSATGMTMFTYAPMSVKVGDKVLFDFGPEYTIDSEKLYILKETDILAIIENI